MGHSVPPTGRERRPVAVWERRLRHAVGRAYPCILESGNNYLPETGFGEDNRGELLDWMPISFEPIGEAVGGYVVTEMDFGLGSPTPDDSSMPNDWVDWSLGDGILNFNLGDGYASIPSGVRPYLAFDTGSGASVTTVMARVRHHGAWSGYDTNDMSAGWSWIGPQTPATTMYCWDPAPLR